ncbi:uncharacterized protein LOC122387268 isoform X1 [Amphibalanus amphitrite]|uniref:uncharacterized protein LOC122387268 isoform X1 n=1 Tax=Amphibalanus amphitrite TaxID=1232801 RepID=UPI001C922BA1|nr:uncharacterized protein LOC122387268 isoform X1 [Amphibalanus amphitrite]XP_043233268.1 uncharacterized protein LOC122387268 isoform X1 [Amphibalanus amphitrite]
MSLKSERALRKGNLTRTRRRAFVLVDTAGSKRELCSVLKDLDVALQALLEVNEKYGLSLEDEDERRKCEVYGEEATEEHRLAVERVEAHVKGRADETPSVSAVAHSSASSKAAAEHATRMAEVENKVREMELKQLQIRLQREEEEQSLRRERQLQEKQDALNAAKLKTELTRAAENELAWDRREDFVGAEQQEQQENGQEAKQKAGKRRITADKMAENQLFYHSLPRLKLPTFSGSVEDWPRWHSLFSAMVDRQDLTNDEKMAHLQNSVSGSARALIGGMICDGSSYSDALKALKERYGQEVDIVHATLKAVFTCAPPKAFDAKSLEKYHGAVHGACTTLKTMKFEGDLQSCENLRRMVSKLPLDLRKSWAEHTLGLERPTLTEFDEWLRTQVGVLLRCEASAPSASTTRQQKNVGLFVTTTTASSKSGWPAVAGHTGGRRRRAGGRL